MRPSHRRRRLSPRAKTLARWFGVTPRDIARADRLATAPPPDLRLSIHPGQILLLTGPSGAGKSTLLRHLRARFETSHTILDLDALPLPETPVIDLVANHFGKTHASLHPALSLLARVGLAELWTCFRTPAQLSVGQRWRLNLALALASAFTLAASHSACGFAPARATLNAASVPTSTRAHKRAPTFLLLADEFAAPLDRITMIVIARLLRKYINPNQSLAALLASAREDLVAPLAPDLQIHCDFGISRPFSRRQKDEG